jgi:hypothetical protein
MSEQGNFQWADVTGTTNLKIDSGTTNVRCYGSSTPVIGSFVCVERPGRKIRIWVADNTAASVVINDVANKIVVASSTTTLAANQHAEFVCVPQSDGTFVWVQTETTGTSS